MTLTDSLYGKYVSERLNAQILESEFGFVVFNKLHQETFIVEFFVDEKSRLQGLGKSLLLELCDLAAESGSRVVTANIFVTDKNSASTLCGALKCGFKISRANNDCISIHKEVGG